MELFKEFVNQYATTVLYTILTGVATFIGLSVKKLYAKYVNDKTKQTVVTTCVRAVEQMYTNLHGADKLDKCIESVADMLNEKGITISDLEIRMLIEASVNAMNKQLSEVFDGIETAGATVESPIKIEAEG